MLYWFDTRTQNVFTASQKTNSRATWLISCHRTQVNFVSSKINHAVCNYFITVVTYDIKWDPINVIVPCHGYQYTYTIDIEFPHPESVIIFITTWIPINWIVFKPTYSWNEIRVSHISKYVLNHWYLIIEIILGTIPGVISVCNARCYNNDISLMHPRRVSLNAEYVMFKIVVDKYRQSVP